MKWTRLDLRDKNKAPRVGDLVALRMKHKNYGEERFDIGRFEIDKDGRKLWLKSTTGTSDPARVKQHYDIWWCPVHEFDGF